MGVHFILDLVYTLSSQITIETSSAFDKAEKVRKNVIAGVNDPENFFGVSFLSFKVSMYPKNISVTRKKWKHGITYLHVNCHLDGKLYNARVEHEPLDTQCCLKLSQLVYYKGSDKILAPSEITRKRKHQSPRSNSKLGSLFDDESEDGRMDNVNR